MDVGKIFGVIYKNNIFFDYTKSVFRYSFITRTYIAYLVRDRKEKRPEL